MSTAAVKYADSEVAGPADRGAGPEHDVVAVPILSVRPGESPRLEGEDKAHVTRLADAETLLPPILVDRRTMRVIDGMHRLLAASLKGQDTVDVVFFDGSPAQAFLLGVEANVRHGLPLSQGDRRAAASRIVSSHPHLADRAIGESTGLAARTVAAIRRSTDALPQLTTRVGRDGRVRPLDGAAGRRHAAAVLAEHPGASLREVARRAGVSPATARDVRSRLECGEEPTLGRARPDRGRGQAMRGRRVPALVASAASGSRTAPSTPAAVERLMRDPALRHNEQGRQLLRLLQLNAVGSKDLSGVIEAVPPHCTIIVGQIARHYAQMWMGFARELDERARVTDPQGSLR
jgi:ParB-like chromosome segregation protein Spo0J